MTTPGSNTFRKAMSVLGKQTVQYYRFKENATQANGMVLATFNPPFQAQGSFQPVKRTKYMVLGLDYQKTYANFYVSKDVLDLQRDVAGDQIVFDGRKYQCISKDAWFNIDGWDSVLCVEVPC